MTNASLKGVTYKSTTRDEEWDSLRVVCRSRRCKNNAMPWSTLCEKHAVKTLKKLLKKCVSPFCNSSPTESSIFCEIHTKDGLKKRK